MRRVWLRYQARRAPGRGPRFTNYRQRDKSARGTPNGGANWRTTGICGYGAPAFIVFYDAAPNCHPAMEIARAQPSAGRRRLAPTDDPPPPNETSDGGSEPTGGAPGGEQRRSPKNTACSDASNSGRLHRLRARSSGDFRLRTRFSVRRARRVRQSAPIQRACLLRFAPALAHTGGVRLIAAFRPRAKASGGNP